MRTIIIAITKDPGNPFTPGLPTPDGPLPMTPLTWVQIDPPFGAFGHLYVDAVDVGPIIAVLIDHEDEKAPPVEPQRGT